MLTSWNVAKLSSPPHERKVAVIALTETEQFLNAFRSDSTGARSSPSAAVHSGSGGRAVCQKSPLSGVGGQDSCRGRVSHRESVLPEKNQQHLPGLFFPPLHISLYKSSCYGFDRWSSPLSRGLPSDQDRNSSAGTSRASLFYRGLKVRALLLMWPPHLQITFMETLLLFSPHWIPPVDESLFSSDLFRCLDFTTLIHFWLHDQNVWVKQQGIMGAQCQAMTADKIWWIWKNLWSHSQVSFFYPCFHGYCTVLKGPGEWVIMW